MIGLIALALGVAGTGIYLSLRPASPPPSVASTTATPSPQASPSTKTAISALGRLEPEGEVIKIAAPSALGSSRVIRLLVKEGQPIKEGQVLAVMDVGDRLMASAMQAEAQVKQAQAQLAQVRAGAKRGDIDAQRAEVSRLEVEVQNADREFRRYQNLQQNGAVSDSDLDTRRLRLETAVRALEEAKQRLSSVAEVRPVDVQEAEAQVQVAIANLQRAKADLDTAVVRSPITGQVIKIHARPGEQVGNDGIAELGQTQQMYAVAEVYETDVPRVRMGQRAIVTSAAFPGKLTGTVALVGLQVRKNDVLNTDPAADTDARVVEVKIRLDDSTPVAGLTNLQVNVAIEP